MSRPTFAPTASQRELGRNLAIDLVGAIGLGVTIALISALLPTIARRGGLEPLGLSALAAAPFVANFLGAFAGRVGPRSSRELAAIRAAGAGALVLLVIAPAPAVMVIVAVLFWSSVSLTGPFQLRLWGSVYPSRLRGRIVGAIGMGRAAAAAAAAFAGGLIADRLGGPRRSRSPGSSGSDVPSRTSACARRAPSDLTGSRRVNRSARSRIGRSWRGWRLPRGSTAAD